jgi:hypothetical protein
LRIGRDIGGARSIERGLDGGFVGLPALFLEVRPADPDGQILGKRAGGKGQAGQRRGGGGKTVHGFLPRDVVVALSRVDPGHCVAP